MTPEGRTIGSKTLARTDPERSEFIHCILAVKTNIPAAALGMISGNEQLNFVGDTWLHGQPGLEFFAAPGISPADVVHDFFEGIGIRGDSVFRLPLPAGHILRAHQHRTRHGLSVRPESQPLHGAHRIIRAEINGIGKLAGEIEGWIIDPRKLTDRTQRDDGTGLTARHQSEQQKQL